MFAGYPISVTVMVENTLSRDPGQITDCLTRIVHGVFWAVVPMIGAVFITHLVDFNKYALYCVLVSCVSSV